MNVQSLTSQICRINCTDHSIVCWSPLLHRSWDAQRKVVTSQPADSSQDSQTAKDSQNRDKEVFVPHSVTIRRLGKRKRIAIQLDFVPKEHNTLLPLKNVFWTAWKTENAIGQTPTTTFLKFPKMINWLAIVLLPHLNTASLSFMQPMEHYNWGRMYAVKARREGWGRRRDLAIKRFYWFYPLLRLLHCWRALQLFYLLKNFILGNKQTLDKISIRHPSYIMINQCKISALASKFVFFCFDNIMLPSPLRWINQWAVEFADFQFVLFASNREPLSFIVWSLTTPPDPAGGCRRGIMPSLSPDLGHLHPCCRTQTCKICKIWQIFTITL